MTLENNATNIWGSLMNEVISSTMNKTRTGMSNAFGWFDVSNEDR